MDHTNSSENTDNPEGTTQMDTETVVEAEGEKEDREGGDEEAKLDTETNSDSPEFQGKAQDKAKATSGTLERNSPAEETASQWESDRNKEADIAKKVDFEVRTEQNKIARPSISVEKHTLPRTFTHFRRVRSDESLPNQLETPGSAGAPTRSSRVQSDGINEAFLQELAKLNLPKLELEETPLSYPDASLIGDTKSPVGISHNDTGNRCVRSWYEFSHVRPLHMCTAHSFVCFRDNGDLVAVTPACVYIYDKPPAACELTYKEPLYSITVSNVFRVADLNDNSILLLRQGGFQITEKRASDELLVAEVGTSAISLLAQIAVPQTEVSIMQSSSCRYTVLRERSSQRNSAECRGMQVNSKEHKVYLLYDYHLAVIDLDMRLEPVILRLRCNDDLQPPLEQTGPAVALMEFDHAVYILTSKLSLLGANKASLFAQDARSCCMAILQTLIDWRVAANEICSYVVDRRHCTAFFSVPKGRKLISLRFSVPAILNGSLDFEPAGAPLLQGILLQDRLYSDANNKDWVAAVPWSLAWDSTTQQLLVLEWGSENNGVLISLDVCLEEDNMSISSMNSWISKDFGVIYDRFLIVKTFSRSNTYV